MNITDLTVHELKDKLKNKELTITQINEAYVNRIVEKENDVNAFVTSLTDTALEKAKEIEEKSLSFIKDRENKGHFKFPSAGSVFKNNRNFGKPSGKIIDEVGLRGFSVGQAQVAPWHGNFIINNGNATASDVRNLVEIIQEKVLKETGFMLECEIIFTDKV